VRQPIGRWPRLLKNRSEGLTNVTVVISMTDTNGRAFDVEINFGDGKKRHDLEEDYESIGRGFDSLRARHFLSLFV